MTEALATQPQKAIAYRLAAIMADAQAIGKDSTNAKQGFRYRGVDAVMNALHPLFAKHGVIILPEVLEERTEERKTQAGSNLIYRVLRVRFNFVASDASSVSCVMVGEGMDSGDKAANKAMAVALKYALTQLLLLPYDEVDPDADTPPPSHRDATPPKPATEAPKQVQSAPPTAAAPSDAIPGDPRLHVEVVLGEVKTQGGKQKNGTPWTLWYTKGLDTHFYSTFDRAIGERMAELAGNPARITYVNKDSPKGVIREVIAIESGAPLAGSDLDAGAQKDAAPSDAGLAPAADADAQRKGKLELPF